MIMDQSIYPFISLCRLQGLSQRVSEESGNLIYIMVAPNVLLFFEIWTSSFFT